MTVDSFILSFRLSFDFPFVARIKIGSGCGGCRSGKGEEGGRGVSVAVLGRSWGDTVCILLIRREAGKYEEHTAFLSEEDGAVVEGAAGFEEGG